MRAGASTAPDLSKGMSGWLWVSGIAAIAASATLAATLAITRSRRMGRKRERDIEADADAEAPPQKALRRSISPHFLEITVGEAAHPSF